MTDTLREKRVELILHQLEDLPPLPQAAARMLEAGRHDDASADEALELVACDRSLTTRVLQLLARQDLGPGQEAQSLAAAVSAAGFDAMRNMVLATSVFAVLAGRPDRSIAHFDREEFWKHSVAAACCAELLAETLAEAYGADSRISPSEAFVCGLLHDLGKAALDTALPKSFDRVVEAADLLRGNIADLERNIIGLDHMVVGKRLAERWGLPPALRECIWLHGQLPAALPATVRNPRLVNLVTLADLLVREQHLGYSGNYSLALPRNALIEAVGLTAEQVAAVMQRLVDHVEPRAKALGLGQTSTHELYLEALTQANRELGRVSGQLTARNRRLAVRAQFFDALSRFQSELRPDAAPQLVLQAIGQTAVSVLSATSAAVFSVMPGQNFAQTLLLDQSGEVFETTVIDCPSTLARPQAGEGPVVPAGTELEWLLAAVSPRLGHDKRYWICLEADNRCIGGVVWGGRAGEAQRLSGQVQELAALAVGWALALRTGQIREESRTLAEQLAEANRRLHSAQEEIQRSKTIMTVGEMAAGAAHEMNNPLAVISGRSQLLASQLTDPKQRHAALLIHEQSERLSSIISELMDFAKPVPAAAAETDLTELLQRAVHEARFATDPVDRVIDVVIGDVPPVVVDAKQIGAALIEVVSNAIQATDPASGRIDVAAAYDAYSAKVVLTITDNGSGMDEATLARAFDPFFSSKPAGRRRGLGLAKAQRWISSNGGSIRLESSPAKGARAIILLPAARLEGLPAPTEDRKAAP